MWFQYPQLQTAPQTHIFGSQLRASRNVKPETRSHELPPPGKKGHTHLCSCMLFLRPTEGARLLLHLWIKELQGQPWTFHDRGNDQPGFTRALNKTASQVDVYLLSQVAFSPGGLYFTIDS
ncbi:unnamed protein product [Sphagnum troendelagicum]|uniref:Nucleotide-diphospho-sugar transferase domain-containing protein n=1 Tax=Sphagnum troendelagicum TaxID=128251 RepID=A0ABP0UIV2_9BRYO